MDMFQEIGYGNSWQAHSLASLVHAHLDSKDYSAAQAEAEIGLQRFQKEKDKKSELISKRIMVNTHLANFDNQKALKSAQESLALTRDLKEKTHEPSVPNCLANVQLNSQEYARAVQFAEHA